MSFSQFGLRQELLQNLQRKGYTIPTPIQVQAIPPILAGHDVLGGAQTGTGKTAAFTLPLLQLLSDSQVQSYSPRVLILTPTRELAAQVGESVKTYGQGLGIKSTIVFGGVGIHGQMAALKRGVDILIATPGRLLDLAGQKAADLSRVQHLVLDESDRMLDMGFIHDIKKILKLVPVKRQTLLFSATYSEEIRGLVNQFMRDPVSIEVAVRKNAAADAVVQQYIPVAQLQKAQLLANLIQEGKWEQVLVFTRTKHGANRLAEKLESSGITSMAIHGNKSQGARTRSLDGFKTGNLRVLVATDIAARGLDIPLLPHVVNYELPHVPEDYVHRIGRTGRAGAGGSAVSLVSLDEMKLLKAIEKVVGSAIAQKHVSGFLQETQFGTNVIPERRRPEQRRSPAPRTAVKVTPKPAPRQENDRTRKWESSTTRGETERKRATVDEIRRAVGGRGNSFSRSR